MTARDDRTPEHGAPDLDEALAILDEHPEYLEAFPPELRAAAEALLDED